MRTARWNPRTAISRPPSQGRHLKTAIAQALIQCCNRDFASLADCRRSVDLLVARRNRQRADAVLAERAHLGPLPTRRTVEPEVRLRRNRLHRDRRSGFSVNSRHPDRRFSGQERLLRCPVTVGRAQFFSVGVCGCRFMTTALRPFSAAPASSTIPGPILRKDWGRDDGHRVHVGNSHHVIHALHRKPFRRRRTSGSTGPVQLGLPRQPVPPHRIRRRLARCCSATCRAGMPAAAWSICCLSPQNLL